MSAYFKHWDCYIFDGVLYIYQITLELISSLFQVRIEVHSVFETNQVLFTSTLNTEYIRCCSLMSVAERDYIGYASLIAVPAPDSIEAEAEFNRKVLVKLSEKYRVVNGFDQTLDNSGMRLMYASDPRSVAEMYSKEVAKYLNMTSLMEFHIMQFQRNEVKY